jgi:hypothetical protein
MPLVFWCSRVFTQPPAQAVINLSCLDYRAMSGLSHTHLKADALAATFLARRYLAAKRCHRLDSRLVIFFLKSFL